jgi:transcriptional regulator with XRE-family HTH domain
VTLKELRENRGLTQADVAKAMGISQGGVSRIESGADHHASTVARYVKALGGELELRVTLNGETFRLPSAQ